MVNTLDGEGRVHTYCDGIWNCMKCDPSVIIFEVAMFLNNALSTQSNRSVFFTVQAANLTDERSASIYQYSKDGLPLSSQA